MEVPRYWRERKTRYSLTGDQIVRKDSKGNIIAREGISFPPGPNKDRFDPSTGERLVGQRKVVEAPQRVVIEAVLAPSEVR